MVFIEPIAPLVDTLHTQCFHGFACAAPQDQVNRQRRTPAATAKLCVHRTKVVLAAESFVSFIPLFGRSMTFPHGKVERFTQERDDRAQVLCGPDKDDV